MPLDLSGFNSGNVDTSGLYKIGQDLQKDKELALSQQRLNQLAQNQQAVRKNATANYLKSYLDPKKFFSGTVDGPIITSGIQETLKNAMQLASQGVDSPTISTIISPQVAQLSQASKNLQVLDSQKQESIKSLSKVAGFDPQKFDDAYNNSAYYNTDAKGNKTIKSISDLAALDPSQDITDNLLRNGDVYNNQGVEDFMKNAKTVTNAYSTKTRNAAGRLTQVAGTTVAPNFMVPEKDKDGVITGFVPQNTMATDGDNVLFNKALGNGNTSQPIQMVSDNVWNSMPPNAMAYIRQEVRSELQNHPDIKLNSPQAENLGKAILFQEMKNSPYNGGHFKTANINMQPLPPRPQPASTIASNTPPQTVDYYNGDKNVQGLQPMVNNSTFPYTRFNAANPSVQKTLLGFAQEQRGDKGITDADLYFTKDGSGGVNLMYKNGASPVPQKDVLITKVDPLLINSAGNQALTKVGTGKTKTQTMNSVINTSKPQQEKKSSGIKWK